MADEKRGPADAIPGAGRRRPPATIDLKATEIASDPVKPSEPSDPAAETPRAEAQAANAAAEPGAETAPPDSKPRRGWRPDWLGFGPVNSRLSGLRSGVWKRTSWRLLGAGAVGAAVAACVFLALWAAGAFNPRDELTVTLAARLAILELQVRELANRPQAAASDPRALSDLAARVAAIEKANGRIADLDARLVKAEQGLAHVAELDARIYKVQLLAVEPRPAPRDQDLLNRVAALEAALRPLADVSSRLDAAGAAAQGAKSRADAAFEAAQKNAAPSAPPAAAKGEIDALAARLAALEQAEKTTEQQIARAAASAGPDRAGRLALVAAALRAAVERGDPFAPELAAVRPLVADPKTLAPLEPFAAAGVPRTDGLARELSRLTGAMLGAAGVAPREGGIIDRLQANAERLVRIRPINEAPGNDSTTVIARAEVKATHGDLSGALAELASLPEPVRAPAQDWITRAEGQAAALAAARGLAESAIGALAKPGP